MVLTIKEGKINGNNVSFSITFDFGGNEMKMEYKGVVCGSDQIDFRNDGAAHGTGSEESQVTGHFIKPREDIPRIQHYSENSTGTLRDF